MNAEIIYFSATGATQKIVEAFSQGLSCIVRFVDITQPKNRKTVLPMTGDLTVIAVPIYGECIPKFLYRYLRQIEGRNKPLVAISVYGNMGFGISLEQFARYANENRFRLIGAGTFIGEHTYTCKELPVALGRPDETDLELAREFGRLVREKFDKGELDTVGVPKSKLPEFIMKFPDTGTRFLIKKPEADEAKCSRCGVCAIKCPTGAIDLKTLKINEQNCLRCYACVKGCQQKARRAEFRFRLFGTIFNSIGRKRKESRFYI